MLIPMEKGENEEEVFRAVINSVVLISPLWKSYSI